MMLGAVLRARSRIRHRRYTKHLSGNFFKRIAGVLIMLLVLLSINAGAMMLFEDMNISDALWLSATTVTTVGYGDFSPSSPEGRIATVISLYLVAIVLLGQLVGEYMDWRSIKSEKITLWHVGV